MPKHLIFDFGAVVFRWQPIDLLQQVLPLRAPDAAASRALAERIFKGYTGPWGRFDLGTIEVPELVDALVDQAGLSADEARRLITAIPPALEPLPDTLSLIERLRAAGHRLFYLSNMPAPFADHLEATHGFLRHFEDGVFSGRVQLAKPDAAIFQLSLQRFGIAAADAVFLDDHPANGEAARALGLGAVLFEHAAQAEAELRSFGIELTAA
jgi:HAD superfamily hydrolase (TIGR01509 family)